MVTIDHDLHTHTTYSDGWDWEEMVAVAEASGLGGIGLTDHCPVGDDSFGRGDRYDFADTYEKRRAELQTRGDRYDVEIFDGAEVNYDPRKESRIREFLDEADFDYAIGSVHYAGEYYVAHPDDRLAEAPDSERRAAIDEYVDWQVQLIESELFDVIAHLDIVQRSPALRGVMEEDDYRRIAEALANSDTVPEINAGRLDRSYGTIHPHPEYLHVFADEGVDFVVGTDSHAPDQLEGRIGLLTEELDGRPIDPRSEPPFSTANGF